jgi:hypothetical protein
MAIGVAVSIVLLGASTPPFIPKGGRGYKEGNRVGYNMTPTRTLSLLTYFTYITIDAIIYALGAHHCLLESSGWWAES